MGMYLIIHAHNLKLDKSGSTLCMPIYINNEKEIDEIEYSRHFFM